MEQLSFDEITKGSREGTIDFVKKILARSDVTHLVKFINTMMDSSRLGESTFVVIGPGCTYKTLAEVKSQWLNDLPSERQYPISFYEKGDPK